MTWRDELLPADFNGVSIFVNQTTREVGRKTVINEYPNRNDVYGEDLGRQAQRFSIQAFVIGDDYLIDRDALIAELEKPGPYTYVDPWGGEQQVFLTARAVIRETTAEGGIARFTIPVVQHKEQEFPRIFDPSAEVKAAVEIAKAKLEEDFAKKFTLGDLVNAIFRGLGVANTALRVAAGKVASKLALVDKLTAEINELNDSIQDLARTPQALANKFIGLAASVKQLAETLRDTVPELDDGLGLGRGTFDPIAVTLEITGDIDDADVGVPDEAPTPDDEVSKRNLQAVEQLSTVTNAITSADTLVALPPNSDEQANTILDTMGPIFEAILEDPNLSDSVFQATKNVQVALVDYQLSIAKDLPRVGVFVANEALPALVVAQIVYQNGKRDADVIRRNLVRNPLFASGDLEVLVDG